MADSNNLGINAIANISDALVSGAARAASINPTSRLISTGIDLAHGYATSTLTSQGFNGHAAASATGSFVLGTALGLAFGPVGAAVGSLQVPILVKRFMIIIKMEHMETLVKLAI